MHAKSHVKKCVRIKSGHEERYIENRSICRHLKKKLKRPSRRTREYSCRVGKIGHKRIHKPSVSELVYRFLERASNRGVAKNQKSNATNRFRKIQREKNSNRSRPDASMKCCLNRESHVKPGVENLIEVLPELKQSIVEVLKFGCVFGFLLPADKEGKVFRVASDLELFNQKDSHKRSIKRKRKIIHRDLISHKRHRQF